MARGWYIGGGDRWDYRDPRGWSAADEECHVDYVYGAWSVVIEGITVAWGPQGDHSDDARHLMMEEAERRVSGGSAKSDAVPTEVYVETWVDASDLLAGGMTEEELDYLDGSREILDVAIESVWADLRGMGDLSHNDSIIDGDRDGWSCVVGVTPIDLPGLIREFGEQNIRTEWEDDWGGYY